MLIIMNIIAIVILLICTILTTNGMDAPLPADKVLFPSYELYELAEADFAECLISLYGKIPTEQACPTTEEKVLVFFELLYQN